MNDKPKFTLIAGINGAGKSTAYKHMNPTQKSELGTRIDPDEMTVKFGSTIIGAKEAVKLRAYCLSVQENFNQETTLTGKSILKTIDTALEKGYELNLIYVSVDSPETAINRVANRVANGGHDIPTESIIKRYPESLQNLKEQIHKFDNTRLIDNTENYDIIFETENHNIIFIGDNLPKWALPAIEEYKKQYPELFTAAKIKELTSRFSATPTTMDELVYTQKQQTDDINTAVKDNSLEMK